MQFLRLIKYSLIRKYNVFNKIWIAVTQTSSDRVVLRWIPDVTELYMDGALQLSRNRNTDCWNMPVSAAIWREILWGLSSTLNTTSSFTFSDIFRAFWKILILRVPLNVFSFHSMLIDYLALSGYLALNKLRSSVWVSVNWVSL